MMHLAHVYLAERRAVGELAATSVEVIRWTLSTFARHVADRPVDTVTRLDVEAWLAPHVDQPNTAKSMLTKLRPFARWLVEHDHVPRDFTVGVRSPRPRKGPARCVALPRVGALVHACPDDRAVLIVLLMVGMGLRCAEVAAITMADVDLERGELAVRGKGGRGRVTRSVPIHDDVARMIRRTGRRHGPLVESYQRPGRALTAHTVSTLVAEWMRDAGIDETAHALRHTFAQELLDAGADWRLVQDALGHASIATTIDIYGRRRPSGLRAAMNGLRIA